MNREPFVTGQYYHIYNRGVDHRDVFKENADYWRFLKSLTYFNTNRTFRFGRINKKEKEELIKPKPNEWLVEIVCYCLMPNHFHLLVKQLKNGGTAKFLQKLLTGYTEYVNTKIKRTGVLFQGRTKSKIIDNDIYLTHLARYILLNPIDLISAGWEDNKLDWDDISKQVKEYKWSSSYTYFKNFNQDNIIQGQFKDALDFDKFISSWKPNDKTIVKIVGFD